MLDALNVAFDAPRARAGAGDAPRVLAIIDHLDAPSSWLVAALLGTRCDAPQATVCVAVDRAPRELVALARKVAKGSARDGARRAMDAGSRAVEGARRAHGTGETLASNRACVIIDGVDALAPTASGDGALEKFLDDVYALDDALDVIVCAHGDVGAARGWLADVADCVVRLEPLKTGSAEDVHGACETTHRTNAFRAEGRARRTRARYAVSELGVKITVAST